MKRIVLLWLMTAVGSLFASQTLYTHIISAENGRIAVRICMPDHPRYPAGAPVVVQVNTFYTPSKTFTTPLDIDKIGAIEINYLGPGRRDAAAAMSSEGVDDYGGPNTLAALRDVIRFASGELNDANNHSLAQLAAPMLIADNVGLYAFSHPGIAATNVMALYGHQLPGVKYLVGRENPTIDVLSSVEVGYFDNNRAILNPFYHYPESYDADQLQVDCSQVGWLVNATYPDGRPFFGADTAHILGKNCPELFGKRCYSVQLTTALRQNGGLTSANWPAHLATPEETAAWWPYRSTPANYPLLKNYAPQLKVLLLFCSKDHIQPLPDKPHIHQAWQGFHETAGLWVRLNPDQSYSLALNPAFTGFPDYDANSEPADWGQAEQWGYPNKATANILMPLAALAEMMDRVQYNQWQDNLSAVLSPATPVQNLKSTPKQIHSFHSYPNPCNPTTTICFSLPKHSYVTLKVFDLLGSEVATLVDEELPAGEHSVVFDAKNLPSGVYFCNLMAGKFSQQIKIELIK